MKKTYVTTQGDMWDSIAHSHLGDTAYTDRLINLNLRYREYYIFPAGIPIILPEIETDPSETLPPWKQIK